jgi:hypothetical protein
MMMELIWRRSSRDMVTVTGLGAESIRMIYFRCSSHKVAEAAEGTVMVGSSILTHSNELIGRSERFL